MDILGTDIHRQGMGCWAIGGQFFSGDQPLGFPGIDDHISTQTIHAALDADIRLFDTAAVYGAGHAERVLGAALKNQPDALVISKLGTSFDETTRQIIADDTDSSNVISAIDESLKRLHRDRIDIMLLHLNTLQRDVAAPLFDQMETARQAGKIRAYGWSTDIPASAAAMSSMPGFVAIEHAMNVFVEVPSIQAIVEQHSLAAFIRSPLAMGVLTGKFDQSFTVPGNDVRSVNSPRRDYFHNAKVAPKHLANLDAIRELLQCDGRTLAQGALGWLMAKSDRNVPLPGARNVAQIQDNAGAIEKGPLPANIMAEIENLIEREPEGEPRAR